MFWNEVSQSGGGGSSRGVMHPGAGRGWTGGVVSTGGPRGGRGAQVTGAPAGEPPEEMHVLARAAWGCC